MLDSLRIAYEKIIGKFPPGTLVGIKLEAEYGQRRNGDIEQWFSYSMSVKACPAQGGAYYFEENIDLDRIDDAAEAILRQIRRAQKAERGGRRQGVNQVA